MDRAPAWPPGKPVLQTARPEPGEAGLPFLVIFQIANTHTAASSSLLSVVINIMTQINFGEEKFFLVCR